MSTNSRFERLRVDSLQMDLANPRIAKYIEMYGDEITAEQMALALGASDPTEGSSTTFYSLRESIRTNGGVIHPIIVNAQPGGQSIVIEGNTRALIYQEFMEQKVEGDWSTIPCMVYDNLSQAEIDAIRLQAHLVGPRDWDPYSKAKYLDHLRNAKHLTLDQIVDFCGGRKREVLDYISGYTEMEKYYRPLVTDDDFDASRFSAFVEVQRPRVREAILRYGFTLGNFAEWVSSGLLSPLNTVRQLPRILEGPKSRDVFLHSGAQEAMKLLSVPGGTTAIADASLGVLAREVCRRVLSMTYSELQRLRANAGSEEASILCEARDHLAELCKDVAGEV